MKYRVILIIIAVSLPLTVCYAVSKSYKGNELPFGKIIGGIQYIRKGQPYLDLNKASIVATFDDGDNSLTLSCPTEAPLESLYYKFTLSDLISIRLSTQLTWDDGQSIFFYDYTVISDIGSRTPIDGVVMEKMFECKSSKSPKWWIGFYNRKLGFQSWDQLKETELLHPGQSLSGFGFESGGPPILGKFRIEGQNPFLGSVGEDEFFLLSATEIDEKHRGVEGITIIPAPQPERIEGHEWIMDILDNLGILFVNGYIPIEHDKAISDIVINLYQDLCNLEKPTFDDWNPLIEKALSDLEPYQGLIEPEAYGFIVENLKYMQRHHDIVWFGKYPKIPK